MKKLLFVSILAISVLSLAQENGYQKEIRTTAFKVGLISGATYSNVVGDKLGIQPDFKLGIDAGMSFEYDFSKNWGLEWDIMYLSRGYNYDVLFTDNLGNYYGEGKIHNNFQYLSVPVLGKYIIGTRSKFSVLTGAYISYLLESRSKSEAIINGEPQTINQVNTGFNKIDFGVCGVIGFEVSIKRLSFGIQGRIYQGLIDIANEYGSVGSNSAVSLSLSLNWDISAADPGKNY